MTNPKTTANKIPTEGIIRKISALFNQAKDSAATDAEAQAFLLKAQELMVKYDIDEVALADADKGDSVSYTTMFATHANSEGYRKPLASVIARNFRCQHYYTGGKVTFFGHTTDVKIAVEAFNYAYRYSHNRGLKIEREYREMGESTRGVANSYWHGFINGLEAKLGEQSQALMVIVPKDVEDKYLEMSQNFRKARGGMRMLGYDGEAYKKGYNDGKAIMNKQKINAVGIE